MMYDATPLWDRMKREGRKMTWLASESGYDRTYLHLIRSGAKPVSTKFMKRMAAVFGVEESTLFLFRELTEVSNSLTADQAAD